MRYVFFCRCPGCLFRPEKNKWCQDKTRSCWFTCHTTMSPRLLLPGPRGADLVRAVGGANVIPGVPFFPEYNVDGEFYPIWYGNLFSLACILYLVSFSFCPSCPLLSFVLFVRVSVCLLACWCWERSMMEADGTVWRLVVFRVFDTYFSLFLSSSLLHASGYYFWGVELGAASFCRELGFPGGFLTEGIWSTHYWDEFDSSTILQKDAVVIGLCFAGEAIDQCTGGMNLYTVGSTPICKYYAPGTVPEEYLPFLGGRNEGNPNQFRITCNSFGTTFHCVVPSFLKCDLV